MTGMLTCPVFSASFKTGHRTNNYGQVTLTARLHCSSVSVNAELQCSRAVICVIVHTKVSVYLIQKNSEVAIFTLHICEVSPAYVYILPKILVIFAHINRKS